MKCPNIKGLSLNCKGLTDPAKSQAIEDWMLNSNSKPLECNLKRLEANYTWHTTNHTQEKGVPI